MTEIPTTPIEPTPPPTPPVSPIRSRRRLIIGIAAGLVAGLVIAVVAVIGVAFALNALTANAVALYTSEAEGYSVMAPGKPTQEEALAGALPTTITHWTDGGRYFSVSSTESGDVPPSQRGLVLHELLTGALKEAPGVSASDLESSAVTEAFLAEPEGFTISGDPALRFTMSVEGAPAPFHIVFAAHGTGLYMLVFSDSDDTRDEDFLDSFTYLD